MMLMHQDIMRSIRLDQLALSVVQKCGLFPITTMKDMTITGFAQNVVVCYQILQLSLKKYAKLYALN